MVATATMVAMATKVARMTPNGDEDNNFQQERQQQKQRQRDDDGDVTTTTEGFEQRQSWRKTLLSPKREALLLFRAAVAITIGR